MLIGNFPVGLGANTVVIIIEVFERKSNILSHDISFDIGIKCWIFFQVPNPEFSNELGILKKRHRILKLREVFFMLSL